MKKILHEPPIKPVDKETKANYLNQLKNYFISLKDIMDVSTMCGGIKTSKKNIIITNIYTKIVVNAYSFGTLLPYNPINKTEFCNYSAVAALGRCIVEACHLYHYIGIDNVSQEENKFRIKLLHFHLNNEKYKLYKEWGADNEVLSSFEIEFPRERAEIKQSTIFNTLNTSMKEKILSGNSPFTLSHIKIAGKFPFMNENKFKIMYRLLSNHTHSTSFIILSQDNERGRGIINSIELFYIDLIVTMISCYMSFIIKHQIHLLHGDSLSDFSEQLKSANKILETGF